MRRQSLLTHSVLLLAAGSAAAQAPAGIGPVSRNVPAQSRVIRVQGSDPLPTGQPAVVEDGAGVNLKKIDEGATPPPEKIAAPKGMEQAMEQGMEPETDGEIWQEEGDGFPLAEPAGSKHGAHRWFFGKKSVVETDCPDCAPQKHGWFTKKQHLEPTDDAYEASTLSEGLNAFSQLPSRRHWWSHY